MMGSGHVELGTEASEEGLPEFTGEFGVAVRDETAGHAEVPENRSVKDLRQLLRSNPVRSRLTDDHFCASAHENHNGCVALQRPGELGDQVQREGDPGCLRYRQGREQTQRSLVTGFDGLTGRARGAVREDLLMKPRSVETTRQPVIGLISAKVATERGVVGLSEERLAQSAVGNVETLSFVQKGVMEAEVCASSFGDSGKDPLVF